MVIKVPCSSFLLVHGKPKANYARKRR
uniref:Uncharacterized protein n=1 Tax=Rhizophora mucronata TaxID=61149 RepID=A0A2P2QL59_RHIMU